MYQICPYNYIYVLKGKDILLGQMPEAYATKTLQHDKHDKNSDDKNNSSKNTERRKITQTTTKRHKHLNQQMIT